jgi:hypothetical protein
MSLYKYQILLHAEDIANERFGCELYDLSPAKREAIFAEAMDDLNDMRAAQADYASDFVRGN